MRNIVLLFLALCVFYGCNKEPVESKVFSKEQISVEDAKSIARKISGQDCRFLYSTGLESRPYGEFIFDCINGQYTLGVGRNHLYSKDFIFEMGQEVEFLYSEEYLIQPGQGETKDQEKNPSYYLWPIRRPVSIQDDKLGSPTA